MNLNGSDSSAQKNECLVLQHLIANARTSDSSIAEHIGITTQAVGKIRKKLEESGIILGYQPMLDHKKIGLELFTQAELIVPPALLAEPKFKKAILEDPHIVRCVRILSGGADLHCTFTFKNLAASHQYFTTLLETYPGLRITALQETTWDLVWKLDRKQAFIHALDACCKKECCKRK